MQGTYETFVEMGRQHYAGSLAGRWILTAGLGGIGGAQPLAATMAGASCLAIECQPSRIEMRLATGYVDAQAQSLDEALVADGTDDAARRLARVLWNDPATGVMRHADAGYQDAIDCAREQRLNLPFLGGAHGG